MTAEQKAHVKSVISEALVTVALDGKNPADVERWLLKKLQPYFVK